MLVESFLGSGTCAALECSQNLTRLALFPTEVSAEAWRGDAVLPSSSHRFTAFWPHKGLEALVHPPPFNFLNYYFRHLNCFWSYRSKYVYKARLKTYEEIALQPKGCSTEVTTINFSVFRNCLCINQDVHTYVCTFIFMCGSLKVLVLYLDIW